MLEPQSMSSANSLTLALSYVRSHREHLRLQCQWLHRHQSSLLIRDSMTNPTKPHHASAHGAHPIHIHPARPLYRFAAVALPASMWFFVSLISYMLCFSDRESSSTDGNKTVLHCLAGNILGSTERVVYTILLTAAGSLNASSLNLSTRNAWDSSRRPRCSD
ncbi:hypothetical protein MRB53_037998 [Persea americana]|nr:hypothetical protein MRB53_037998 [Persea americana]